jgi:hypothetical protein
MTHHGPDLNKATTFPYIVFSALLHHTDIQMAFFPRTFKEEFRNYPDFDSWEISKFITSYLDL